MASKGFIRFLFALFLAIIYCIAEENEEIGSPLPDETVEEAIADIETISVMADKVLRDGILPLEETEKYYNDITDLLEDLTRIINEPTNAHMFLKAKGIDRVLLPNIRVKYPKLRLMLLRLMKEFFQNLPAATVATIPLNIIDQLVEVFEKDANLGVKAYALDILCKCLPKNPEAQVRIMKTKGLEPFYRQIPKLNMAVVSTLLELFETILKEHVAERSDINDRSKEDSDKYILYQQMGLMERVSTPAFCNGLLSVLGSLWTYTYSNDVTSPVFELIKSTKPFCLKFHKGQKKAIKFFQAIFERFQNEAAGQFERYHMNREQIKTLIEGYVEDIKDDSVISSKVEL